MGRSYQCADYVLDLYAFSDHGIGEWLQSQAKVSQKIVADFQRTCLN